MRFVRIGPAGEERPGVLVDDTHYADLSAWTPDIDGAFLADGVKRVREAWHHITSVLPVRAIGDDRIGPPIARPHQIICIGLNYADHAAESGADVPGEPVMFTKAPNSMVGPYDDVRIPRGSTATDWEVELGVVIGTRARYLDDEETAAAAIAGYVLVNDVSERIFQLERGGQWSKGKSAETFNPTGPWLMTADECGEPSALPIWTTVSGKRVQDSVTSSMIFKPAAIVHYLSQFMVLEPGDLINTGTPSGVGLGMRPPRYLEVGDVMEVGIEGLGRQRQRVVDWQGVPSSPGKPAAA